MFPMGALRRTGRLLHRVDTAAVGNLLAKEFDGAYWVSLALEPARYSGPDVPVDRLMPELINAGENVFRQFMRGEEFQEFAVPCPWDPTPNNIPRQPDRIYDRDSYNIASP